MHPITLGLLLGLLSSPPPAPAAAPDAFHVAVEQDAFTIRAPGYRVERSEGRTELTLQGADEVELGSFAFQLASVERGEEQLFEPGAMPTARALEDGVAVEHERFRELYEVRALGLEQSFVFDEPLPGSGDLVVRLRLETALETCYASSSTATFGTGGTSLLAIQDVVGIDATGRRFPGELALEGDELLLRLRAHFVDGAVYPLVLDPLLAPVHVFYVSHGFNGAADIAYGVDEDMAYIVWRELTKGLLVARIQGSTLVDIHQVDAPESDYYFSDAPAIAYMRAANVLVIAMRIADQGDDGPLHEKIAVLTLDPGSVERIDSTTFDAPDVRSLDIGGDPTDAGELACVVWETSVTFGSVNGAWVKVDAGGQVRLLRQTSLSFTNSESTTYRSPRISQSNGPKGCWLCVWEVRHADGSYGQVEYRVIGYDGSLGEIGATSSAGKAPSCDGDGERFLIAYIENDDSTLCCELTDPFGPPATPRARRTFEDVASVFSQPQVSIVMSLEHSFFPAYSVTWIDPGTSWPRGEVLSEPALDLFGSGFASPPLYSLVTTHLRSASRFAADFDPLHLADRFSFTNGLLDPSTGVSHLGYATGRP